MLASAYKRKVRIAKSLARSRKARASKIGGNRAIAASVLQRAFRRYRSAAKSSSRQEFYWQAQNSQTSSVGFQGATSSVPVVIDCTAIVAAGTSNTNRLGNRITLKGIALRGEMSTPSSVAACICRVLVVLDRENIGQGTAGVTQANLFWDASSTSVFSQQNPNYFERYKILWDKTFAIGTGSTSNLREVALFNDYIGLRGLETVYPSSSTGTAYKNGIFIVAISDQTLTGQCGINVSFRLDFNP